MAINKAKDGTCTISSRQVWLPGVYENERAARYGFRFHNRTLQELQDWANARGSGVITFADLQAARSKALSGS